MPAEDLLTLASAGICRVRAAIGWADTGTGVGKSRNESEGKISELGVG